MSNDDKIEKALKDVLGENIIFRTIYVKNDENQSKENLEILAYNRELEERLLRHIDKLEESYIRDHSKEGLEHQRALTFAKFNVQQAFMWINRSMNPPERIKLPED